MSSVGSQWADCDADSAASVPGNVRVQPTGCYTAAPGMSPGSSVSQPDPPIRSSH